MKVAMTVRGGVLKFTLVVDNDTTVHGVHTDTLAVSPSVLIKCAFMVATLDHFFTQVMSPSPASTSAVSTRRSFSPRLE